jgi:hypothetical protein
MKSLLNFSISLENRVAALQRGDLGLKVQARSNSGKELKVFTEV